MSLLFFSDADLREIIEKTEPIEPIFTQGGRYKWPFSSMSIGDAVVICGELGLRAQAAAHVYARVSGMSFVTKTVENKTLIVRAQ